eukprot:TRINITY_DN1277_c2_g1_i1.p3 TRINITY_DN1277_c2_g1~~TRINITY_DN1277_c2_g1_i1.p3  ORF type:complete len:110 (-),score=15.42 TRINITY_DN1277_c2_g1_i1:122-451(-)
MGDILKLIDAAGARPQLLLVPHTTNDCAAFDDFTSYLSSKNKAGVVRTSAGPRLFVLPPTHETLKLAFSDQADCLYVIALEDDEARAHNGPSSHHSHHQASYASGYSRT